MKIILSVSPRSSRNKVVMKEDGTYKIFLTAAPVDGKANVALIKILADHFEVGRSKIKIVRGETNKNKIIEIDD